MFESFSSILLILISLIVIFIAVVSKYELEQSEAV